LKQLEERSCKHESESVTVWKLLGGREKMKISASIILKYSVVKEEAVEGRLLENEMCSFGM